MSEERKPLLGEGSMKFKVDSLAFTIAGELPHEESRLKTTIRYGMVEAKGFYENLIDTGVLIVAKEAYIIDDEAWGGDSRCSSCNYLFCAYESSPPRPGEFCLCGARITIAPASPSRTHPK